MFLYFYFLILILLIGAEGDDDDDDASSPFRRFQELLFSENELMGAEVSFVGRFPVHPRKCSDLDQNLKSPYVVLILYKNSGNFLGMGGIIGRKIVLTADTVVRKAFSNPQDILILAGYLSPWWGKNAQVRTVTELHPNDYELVLVKVHPEFKFNDHVKAIKIKKSKGLPDKKYNDFSVFGIHTGNIFAPGDKIPKESIYTMIKHTPTEKKNCEDDYKDLIPGFNDSVHFCFFPNGSFCSGCVGSPVVGTPKNSFTVRLVGIVIRSTCASDNQKVLMVNVPIFTHWVSFQQFFGPI